MEPDFVQLAEIIERHTDIGQVGASPLRPRVRFMNRTPVTATPVEMGAHRVWIDIEGIKQYKDLLQEFVEALTDLKPAFVDIGLTIQDLEKLLGHLGVQNIDQTAIRLMAILHVTQLARIRVAPAEDPYERVDDRVRLVPIDSPLIRPGPDDPANTNLD